MKLTSFRLVSVTKATKIVQITITSALLSFCSTLNLAQAGIINTDNDTFIDQDTQLEWMDFGINNQIGRAHV